MTNLGLFAFLDLDHDADPVAVKLRHLRINFDRIVTLVEVFPYQFLLDTVDGQFIENLALGYANLGKRRKQRFGRDLVVAVQLNRRDGRTLDDLDHQDIALASDLDLLEETAAVEVAYARPRQCRGQPLTDLYRQKTEHGAFGDSLQPVHADFVDRKCLRRSSQAEQGQ